MDSSENPDSPMNNNNEIKSTDIKKETYHGEDSNASRDSSDHGGRTRVSANVEVEHVALCLSSIFILLVTEVNIYHRLVFTHAFICKAFCFEFLEFSD